MPSLRPFPQGQSHTDLVHALGASSQREKVLVLGLFIIPLMAAVSDPRTVREDQILSNGLLNGLLPSQMNGLLGLVFAHTNVTTSPHATEVYSVYRTLPIAASKRT